jgi:hypothetical protein
MPPLSAAMDTVMTVGQLVKRHVELPLHDVKAWSDKVPFKMDALGLVTLLGADEVSTAIGSLQRRRYTGALPLLAAFILAGDRFTSIQPGFVAYNLTDGITTTEMAGWFTRWLMSQSTNNATTTFEWRPRQRPADPWRERIIASVISCLLVMPLVICTGLMGDWYGVANAGAIVISIASRLYILGQRRQARDALMSPCDNQDIKDNIKTLIITRSDGRMVTVHTPSSTIKGLFRVASIGAKRPFLYRLAQQAAWVALGTHMLVLGMCTLVTQVYTVILLVASTVAVSSTTDWSADTQQKTATSLESPRFPGEVTSIPFNDDWDVIKTVPASYRDNPDGDIQVNMDRRMFAYARLVLSKTQEAFLKGLRLMPDETNELWWDDYCALRQEYKSALPQHDKSTGPTPPFSSGVALESLQPSIPKTADTHTLLLRTPSNTSTTAATQS